MQAILNDLQQAKAITTAETQRLSQAVDKKAFLGALVKIFEDKALLYLSACKGVVKNELKGKVSNDKIDAIVLEKTIECAFSVIMKTDKFCTLPSLMFLTKEIAPDIQASLGLRPLATNDDNLHGIAEKVFVGYFSRYRLIRMVNMNALATLCKEAETDSSLVFPPYLVNAMQIESQLAQEIKTLFASNNGVQERAFLANLVSTQKQVIHHCLGGTVYFLGKLIGAALTSETLRKRHFEYLSNPQTHTQFIKSVTDAYIEEMGKLSVQQKEESSYLNTLSSTISGRCLPALALMGISVSLDRNSLNAEVEKLEKAKKEVNEKQEESAKTVESLKKEAMEKIDKWRSSIPDRPVTWGMSVGIPFK